MPSSIAVQGFQTVARSKITGSPRRNERSNCSGDQAQCRCDGILLPPGTFKGAEIWFHATCGQVSPVDPAAYITKSRFFSLRLISCVPDPLPHHLLLSPPPQPLAALRAHHFRSSLRRVTSGPVSMHCSCENGVSLSLGG